MRDYFSEATKKLMTDAVKAIEQNSSAEIVIALRRQSGSYRAADLTFASALAFVALLLLLFLPYEFALEAIPLEVGVAFAFGFLWASHSRLLRRALSGSKAKASAVGAYARCAFHELGVSKTKGRSGILVYISILEQKVEVITDWGIDPKKLGPQWENFCAELQVRLKSSTPERFAEHLQTMGNLLATEYPRAADDENELADEVDAS